MGTECFTQTHPGLDHIASRCDSRPALEKWRARQDELGVANSEIVESPIGLHLNLRDPDNIALELFVPPA